MTPPASRGFTVAARTILELGAELISSDAIALYELIKNAYDANSRRAVVNIVTVFKFSEKRNVKQRIDAVRRLIALGKDTPASALVRLKTEIAAKVDDTAPVRPRQRFLAAIAAIDDLDDLEAGLEVAFEACNRITISDTGDGMSLRDLQDVFLTIGTTSRLTGALTSGRRYVGGKGIGRLSAMRLGNVMEVRTATMADDHWNELRIDWRVFTHSSSETLEEIPVRAGEGDLKEDPGEKGTRIRIRGLKADWDQERVKKLVDRYFDRLFDPFQGRNRYPLTIRVNERDVTIPAFDREILAEAQAKATIRYTVVDGPRLTLEIDYLTRSRATVEVWTRDDILGITSASDISVAALETLGPFEASFHWFNRQRIKGIDGYGDRTRVKDVVNTWANGLLMYRDGFRVNPYGNPDDDWLGIDSKALSAGGYKVNRKQLIGAVYISAADNPLLIDQTNREGLRANEEKDLLILLLTKAITDNFKNFLNSVEKEARKATRIDAAETGAYLDSVSARVKRSVRLLSGVVSMEHRSEVVFLDSTLNELQRRLVEARQAITTAERDQRDLVDLAGVGLQVEIVAHELSRVTRRTLDLIAGLQQEDLPDRAMSTFDAVESQMLVIRRRLDVLDPLGPNSRNRKTKVDLAALVDLVLASHDNQFARYGIEWRRSAAPRGAGSFEVKAVEGMLVQVLENLIDNSVFWLRQKMRLDPSFEAAITIEVDAGARELRLTDNGPGVPRDRREEIFKPFRTFKPPGEGKGLGLYISREIAQRHSSDLYMLDEPDAEDRLHTFVLDIDGS